MCTCASQRIISRERRRRLSDVPPGPPTRSERIRARNSYRVAFVFPSDRSARESLGRGPLGPPSTACQIRFIDFVPRDPRLGRGGLRCTKGARGGGASRFGNGDDVSSHDPVRSGTLNRCGKDRERAPFSFNRAERRTPVRLLWKAATCGTCRVRVSARTKSLDPEGHSSAFPRSRRCSPRRARSTPLSRGPPFLFFLRNKKG